MKHYSILDNDSVQLVGNLSSECIDCFANCTSSGNLISNCPKYGGTRRQGKISNSKTTTFLCCDKTKTTKLFKEKLEVFSLTFPDLLLVKNEIQDSITRAEQKKVNRLVHNLTSINAFNIQEIYDLVPQSVLTTNWQEQLKYIQKEVVKNPKQAAMKFLRIAKNNIHMKSEFSIYRKLDRDNSTQLEFQFHPLRTLILNVLHTFFADFTDKNIYIEMSEFYAKVKVDYETVQVALYHLIENALKYTKPSTKIKIEFEVLTNSIKVSFSMLSLYVKNSERDLIFQEGYSGELATKSKKNGDGIGMWRIKQMMELNGGEVEVSLGDNPEKIMGFEFANNKFTLVFPK
ncbi:sensor histidine kinase [Flavobacterium stagni]|uniref:histidine kinase n=1 Tax=Flavobacterium stagni TaxID=2506421 RepID=A0A4Q1KA88_9FLAO|nr:HAMP domain-containing sensor histidine kinase [Flavobacterium stagni]RXR23042.1 HAMP domain-containing histidine kinase [Flavobacterium stagni]